MNDLKRLLENEKQKPYRQKEEWSKFLDAERLKVNRRLKRQNKYEILMDRETFELLEDYGEFKR